MKFLNIRTAAGASLLSLLVACGGVDRTAETTVQHTGLQHSAMAAPQLASSRNPVPDCQPENCEGLRIIDGNAEAYRIDAMRRASADGAGTPQS